MTSIKVQQELYQAIAFSNLPGVADTTNQISIAYKNGADLDAFFEDGETPLTEAIMGGIGSYKAVKELLLLGANPNKTDKNGWSPWNACISRLHDRSVAEEQEKIKTVLTEYKANREGEEVINLWQAAQNGDYDRVKYFLEQDINPNSKLVCPLTVAVFSEKVNLVELLLSNAANVDGNDEKDNFNLTPLLHAASSGNLEIIKLLLANGADLRYEIHEGDDVLNIETYANDSGHPEVAAWLHTQLEHKV